MRGLIGKKLGMTRIFDEDGSVIPVTIVQAGPCLVTQIKTLESDGYESIQVGYLNKKTKNTTRPARGHFKKANIDSKKIIAEFSKVPGFDYALGQVFHVGIFSVGDYVRVSGRS